MNINEIATLANNLGRKPNKEKAFENLCKMIEAGDLTDDSLSVLYAYFLPSVSKPKNKEQWVQLAVAKKDIRYYLNNAHVREERLTGTDGHRLHTCSTDLEDGFYDKAMNKIEVDGVFPDMNRVIPKSSQRKMTLLGHTKVTAVTLRRNGKVLHYLDVTFDRETTVRFQKKYWDDAVSVMSDNAGLYYGQPSESVLIFEDDMKAVLMPVRP